MYPDDEDNMLDDIDDVEFYPHAARALRSIASVPRPETPLSCADFATADSLASNLSAHQGTLPFVGSQRAVSCYGPGSSFTRVHSIGFSFPLSPEPKAAGLRFERLKYSASMCVLSSKLTPQTCRRAITHGPWSFLRS
jgi:hypothetical protein